MSKVGRLKMEVVPVLLKAGKTAVSLGFGKPKLKAGAPEEDEKTGKVGLVPSISPKIFSSKSRSCW